MLISYPKIIRRPATRPAQTPESEKIMPVIGDTLLTVVLPSGNRALYSVGPQHITPSASNVTQNENVYMYGQQVAVELNGAWYRSGLSEQITDLKTLALIDRAPQADTIPGGRYA